MNKKTIKRLCKISEVLGCFVIVGGYFCMLFSTGPWEEIIIKASTFVLFFGVVLLIPQDVLDKRERDELGDFSFQSIVPLNKTLCGTRVCPVYRDYGLDALLKNVSTAT